MESFQYFSIRSKFLNFSFSKSKLFERLITGLRLLPVILGRCPVHALLVEGPRPVRIRLLVVVVEATVACVLLMLFNSNTSITHSLVFNLAQLVLTLVHLCLLCIILVPQLLVPFNFKFKLLILIIHLLLQAIILVVKLSETFLQVLILLLHHLEVLPLDLVNLLQIVNISLAFFNLGLQDIIVRLKLLLFRLTRLWEPSTGKFCNRDISLWR